MQQGREVPSKVAEGFLKGVNEDPKFQRFHERLACLSQSQQIRESAERELAELRSERARLSEPDPRTLGTAMLIAAPFVALAVALPWWPARAVELTFLLVALVYDEVVARRASRARLKRVFEITNELEETTHSSAAAIDALNTRVADIDREAEASIKIIDPDSWGQTLQTKKEEKRSS